MNQYSQLINVFIPDDVPSMFGPTKEHDIPVWPRPMPNVWRSDDRMSDLPKSCGKKDSALLEKLTNMNDLILTM